MYQKICTVKTLIFKTKLGFLIYHSYMFHKTSFFFFWFNLFLTVNGINGKTITYAIKNARTMIKCPGESQFHVYDSFDTTKIKCIETDQIHFIDLRRVTYWCNFDGIREYLTEEYALLKNSQRYPHFPITLFQTNLDNQQEQYIYKIDDANTAPFWQLNIKNFKSANRARVTYLWSSSLTCILKYYYAEDMCQNLGFKYDHVTAENNLKCYYGEKSISIDEVEALMLETTAIATSFTTARYLKFDILLIYRS
ncbi:unnamed protein product [Didymodactylos carnosus]|uniref:Uncharacterized protein n=1 Tax=Didymodactylos carnosus TaxID=1234261 RepID=A0A814Z7L2_9BILA|nr:unnamed protein product [Didymodactylos carnosus]CAF4001336.1 unnamed protein product [Didymodactylos carnosus]